MKRAAESHPIGYRSGKDAGLVLGAVQPIADRQRAAVPTLADMLLGEAL